MSVRRYVPSGKGGAAAAAVLGVSLIAGVAVGVAEGVVSRWLSLFFVFPLFIGVAAGAGAVAMIDRLKLRAPALALVCGALGGAGGYVAVHATEYVQFRSDVAGTLAKQHTSDAEVGPMLDDMLRREVGDTGIVGYLKLVARTGVRIKRTQSWDKNSLTLTGTSAWILWAAELALAAGVAGAVAFGRARMPFCEACNAWFAPSRSFAAGGSDTRAGIAQLRAAMAASDIAGAAAAFRADRNAKRALQLTARACPQCGSDSFVQLVRITGAKKPRVLDGWLMSQAEYAQLQQQTQTGAQTGARTGAQRG